MNVNRVQHTPYFTSLYIKKGPETETKLNMLPLETSNKILEAGKLLGKDGDEGATKYYHVEVDENLKCKLVSNADAYFGLFNNEEYKTSYGKAKANGVDVEDKNIIMIQTKNGHSIAGVSRMYQDGTLTYNAWGVSGVSYTTIEDIDMLAKLAKILDGVAAEKYKEQVKKQQEVEAERKAVIQNTNQLLNLYGL